MDPIEQKESGTATVEELQSPGELIVAVETEPEPPRDPLEVGYRYGQLEARMAALEERNARLEAANAAFEEATISAIVTEQAELEQQGAVLADVAEEVLPPEHEGANEMNPEHQAKKPRLWEAFFGGHHR
jgi:exonuclease VII small subunit